MFRMISRDSMRINRKFKTIRPTDSWHQAAIAPTNGVTTPQHITRPCDRHMMRPRRIGDRENKKRTEELHIRKDWIIPFSPIFADVGPARELHRRCRNSASRCGVISAASGCSNPASRGYRGCTRDDDRVGVSNGGSS